MSIKFKMTAMLGLLGIVSLASGIYIFMLLSKANNDAQLLNLLGRQRMLTQDMAKSALGFVSSKDSVNNITNRVLFLDKYITKMRKVYTKNVIGAVRKANIGISMDPASESDPSVPFPATFTRFVNASRSAKADGRNITVDIIAKNPINPKQGYKTAIDKEAGLFLTANPLKLFTKTENVDGKTILDAYTADTATVKGCAQCHTRMGDRTYKKGDLLGIRHYRVRLADTAAAGRQMLNPTLDEFKAASKVFGATLAAMKSGGKVPLDLGLKRYGEVLPLADPLSQNLIPAVEKKFATFNATVNRFMNDTNRSARSVDILLTLKEANQLRKVSNDLVSQYASYASQTQTRISWSIVITTLIILIALGIVFFVTSKSVIARIKILSGNMAVLADGNTNVDISYAKDSDELGDMASAVQVFKENAVRIKQMETKQAETAKRTEDEKRNTMNQLADDFQNAIGAVVQTVFATSSELQASARTLSVTSEEASNQSTAVARASQEASSNVQTVASAAEELSSSINEISRQVSQSTEISTSAVAVAERANNMIQGLDVSVQKIGEVVEMITGIADQTNLLALNATIEAARAGEAGKGFAVVASEVKTLANQTAKATDEIGSQIGDIQSATQNSVQAIQEITKTIGEMSEISAAISAAVEEQSAAAQEIARNVEQAAMSTSEVSSNISDVHQAVGETGRSATEVLSAADGLSQQSESLRTEVDSFISKVRVP